ncbi:hypothetical protein ABMA58_18225 [Oceanospirillum sp. HFRX-1_2]
MDNRLGEALINTLANDPSVYALLIVGYLLLFRLKSEKGRTLFIGLCLIAAPHFFFIAVFASGDLIFEYDLLSFLSVIDFLRYIGAVVCGYAFLSQASTLRAKMSARKPVSASLASGLPPQFQRHRDHFDRRSAGSRPMRESTERFSTNRADDSDHRDWRN